MSENRIQLTNWSVGNAYQDLYTAPECRGIRLRGTVSGHPRKDDGERVITSIVQKVAGRIITTSSGSEYELVGEPEAGYLEYLRESARGYDPEAPIRGHHGR